MGADLLIVVFAVVVIGGMGSILGAIVTGFGLGIIEGLTKVFYPEASNTVIFVVMVIVRHGPKVPRTRQKVKGGQVTDEPSPAMLGPGGRPRHVRAAPDLLLRPHVLLVLRLFAGYQSPYDVPPRKQPRQVVVFAMGLAALAAVLAWWRMRQAGLPMPLRLAWIAASAVLGPPK